MWGNGLRPLPPTPRKNQKKTNEQKLPSSLMNSTCKRLRTPAPPKCFCRIGCKISAGLRNLPKTPLKTHLRS